MSSASRFESCNGDTMRPVSIQVLVIAGLALLPALGTGWRIHSLTKEEAALRPFEVTLQMVQAWDRPVLWVDARAPADFERDHVPGALPLDEAHWEERLIAVLEAWQPELRVVVYCSETACSTSARVAERLRSDLGTEEVYYLRGGFAAWKN